MYFDFLVSLWNPAVFFVWTWYVQKVAVTNSIEQKETIVVFASYIFD